MKHRGAIYFLNSFSEKSFSENGFPENGFSDDSCSDDSFSDDRCLDDLQRPGREHIRKYVVMYEA